MGFFARKFRQAVNVGADVGHYYGGGKADRKAQDAVKALEDQKNAIRIQEEEKQTAVNAPYIQSGFSANKDLMDNANFDPAANFDFKADPGYAFRLKEQQDAMMNRASAMGQEFNPGTLSALAGRSGEMASEEYGNAFDRRRATMNDRFDRLSSIANRGQNSGYAQMDVNRTSADKQADYTTERFNAGNAILQNRQNMKMNLYTGGLKGAAQIGGAFLNSFANNTPAAPTEPTSVRGSTIRR